jgi:diguanylate cyclase (GGDEF)-like protein
MLNQHSPPKVNVSDGSGTSGCIQVLLVEDNPRDAELVRRHLARNSEPQFEVTVAAELSSALSLAHRNYDVVLLDLSLPDSRGLTSLEELIQALPNIPVVVLTGLEQEATAVQAIRHGAQDYLVKRSEDDGLLRRSVRFAIERKAFEIRLSARAHYDRLTGLANRALFEDRLANALARARRASGRIALMFIDLDGFKTINDTYGHDAGDEVLRRVGEQLCAAVRQSDTVARYGGDEFTVLLDPTNDAGAVTVTAERVLRAVNHPIRFSEGQLQTTPSIGIAMFPDHALDSATLVRYADMAMFRAKNLGRNRYQFHQA